MTDRKFEEELAKALGNMFGGEAKVEKIELVGGGAGAKALSELIEALTGGGGSLDTLGQRVRRVGRMTAEGVGKMIGSAVSTVKALDEDRREATCLFVTKEAAVAALGLVAMSVIPESYAPDAADAGLESDKIIDSKLNHNALLFAALVAVASENATEDNPMKDSSFDPMKAANEQFKTLTGRYFEHAMVVNCDCKKCSKTLAEIRAHNETVDRDDKLAAGHHQV